MNGLTLPGDSAQEACRSGWEFQVGTKRVLCRGFTMEMAWAISEIRGEAAAEEGRAPEEPHPAWGPESVVCGQLQALR